MTFRPARFKRTISRREFLRGTVFLGGVAAAERTIPGAWAGGPETLLPAGRRFPGPSILDLPAGSSPIDHIVVLMMENRSFDHYLGWLATDTDYLERGRIRYGRDFSVDGSISQIYKNPQGQEVETYYLPERTGETSPYRGCGHPDPGHGWNQGRIERDAGFLARGSGNDQFALGYYAERDLPVYAALARRFTIFDRYHASLLGPTFPNRGYLHAAQSGGSKDNSLSLWGFPWPTIWDRLGASSVPATYYFVDLPVTALWGPRLIRFTCGINRYFEDAAAGKLPNVVFVDPGFIGETHNDDHPFTDIRLGQKFVFDVFKAFVQSRHWRSGLFIVTYDEWGGFFDHVAPPILPDDQASNNDQENFGQAGFRVPTFLASPYARPGFVDHRLYEHTSILRFIEWRFLGAPAEGPGAAADQWFLTKRDRNANNIGSSLALESFDPEISLPSPAQTISRPCPLAVQDESSDPSSRRVSSPISENPFQQALDSGYFEAVGYKINSSPYASVP